MVLLGTGWTSSTVAMTVAMLLRLFGVVFVSGTQVVVGLLMVTEEIVAPLEEM